MNRRRKKLLQNCSLCSAGRFFFYIVYHKIICIMKLTKHHLIIHIMFKTPVCFLLEHRIKPCTDEREFIKAHITLNVSSIITVNT